jgi:predicted CXXCH cytochrome family protein
MSTVKRVLGGVLATFVGVSSALFIAAPAAYADAGPHRSRAINEATVGAQINTLGDTRCASCHRAHTAKSPYLLAASNQEDLCFTCHGDGGAGASTNVESGISSSGGALRGGGFSNAMIDADNATKDLTYNAARQSYSSSGQVIPVLNAPAPVTSSHLGGPNVVWGNGPLSGTENPGTVTTAATKLECGSCHDPHGNGNYRILKPVPNNAPSGTNPVVIPDTSVKEYTTENYWQAADVPAFQGDTNFRTTQYLGATSVTSPTPITKNVSASLAATGGVDKYLANVAAWCTTCHTRYLAPSGSWQNNSGDAVFTYRHTGENISGEVANNRNCIHGSNAEMTSRSAVEYPGQPLSAETKSMDSRLLRVSERGMCLMCHNV